MTKGATRTVRVSVGHHDREARVESAHRALIVGATANERAAGSLSERAAGCEQLQSETSSPRGGQHIKICDLGPAFRPVHVEPAKNCSISARCSLSDACGQSALRRASQPSASLGTACRIVAIDYLDAVPDLSSAQRTLLSRFRLAAYAGPFVEDDPPLAIRLAAPH